MINRRAEHEHQLGPRLWRRVLKLSVYQQSLLDGPQYWLNLSAELGTDYVRCRWKLLVVNTARSCGVILQSLTRCVLDPSLCSCAAAGDRALRALARRL
jgi:hypothetical protein